MNTQLLREQVVRVVFSLSPASLVELWSTVQALRDRPAENAEAEETPTTQIHEDGNSVAQQALLQLRQIGLRQSSMDAVALVRAGRDGSEQGVMIWKGAGFCNVNRCRC